MLFFIVIGLLLLHSFVSIHLFFTKLFFLLLFAAWLTFIVCTAVGHALTQSRAQQRMLSCVAANRVCTLREGLQDSYIRCRSLRPILVATAYAHHFAILHKII